MRYKVADQTDTMTKLNKVKKKRKFGLYSISSISSNQIVLVFRKKCREMTITDYFFRFVKFSSH